MQQITSRDNHIIKYVVKLIKSASFRKEEQKFIAEGQRLCNDALRSNTGIYAVLFSETFYLRNTLICTEFSKKSAETYVLTDTLFKAVSDTKTPQGVMCICYFADKDIIFKKGCRYIALENIQDPANMGTILRTAEALGISGAICSKDCCDCYSPKVLRGSMGAVFRLPIAQTDDFGDFIKRQNEKGFLTIAAVPDSNAMKITEYKGDSVIAFIGNEGNGLTAETINLCKQKVTIPMLGRAESLNASAAAAIVMWEIMK